jgi:hypothetical protein
MRRFLVAAIALGATLFVSLILSIGVIAGCPWSELPIH